MTQSPPTTAHPIPQPTRAGNLFGVPLGDMGWFASLLMGVASGFMAFFAATFCTIVFILIDNSVLHGNLDYSFSYRWVGLPIGLVVMAAALSYLGTLWLKRMLRRN